jgi:hypothetical protein
MTSKKYILVVAVLSGLKEVTIQNCYLLQKIIRGNG